LSLLGTFGEVAATLVHVVAEDQRYLERISGSSAPVAVVEDDQLTQGEVVGIFANNAERGGGVVRRLPETDITLPAPRRWPAVSHAESLIMLEAIQHGNDHRTHVTTVLSSNGVDFPVLDGWHFWQECVLDRAKLPQ